MKSYTLPLYLSSGQSASASKLDNPLAAFLGSLVLVFVVAIHFYALGAKSDPAVLAYEESATWQIVETAQSSSVASASSVLFSKQDFSSLDATASTGTILSTNTTIIPNSNRSFGLSNSPSNSFGLEATLLVLNFGP